MIGEVVSFGTELEPIFPEDGEGLDQCDIPVHQARRTDIVANAVLDVKRPGRGRSKERSSAASGRCKPLRPAGSTSRTSKFAQVRHPSVLPPELAHGSR